ncbi:FHA domain-containing protein [Mycobacterium avium]|nr:FHA domain-containing protein [Mycobacterium avium]MBZ4631317.1 FHA domain-containing protein [Mycobacterium avium subsp. hominissuis]MDV3306902.1 FHA domain-containing protein [Mycobacterium avium subsp. hominissuis]QWY65366.1 FHA domain-containing protein [Mycobacterium avium subsp. hominissuis]
MTVDQAAPPAPATLTVHIGTASHTLNPMDGAVVIGRDPSAAIRINDERISRSHLRLEPRHDGWHAIDTSRNGVFVDGVRRSSVLIARHMTLHLGDANGIAVTVAPGDPADMTQTQAAPQTVEDDDETSIDTGEIDPNILRAGRAVAARRRELDITQRGLARDKIINAGALIAFEKGRSWPRRGTLAKLEEVLQKPPGWITSIRLGEQPEPDNETTEITTNTVRAPLMAEAVELAMHTITATIEELPKPSDPEFTPKATAILADLRKLESVAANAARTAKGAPSVIRSLSTVRRSYKDMMLKAARSPAATIGQRLYAARHRADLSAEEAAYAAGVAVDVVTAVEEERPIPPGASSAIETLIAQLSLS